MSDRRIAVLLKGYPRLSETFIAQELRGLEKAGLRLHLVSMRHPTDTRRHPVHDEIEAPVTYLPEYLHHEPLRVLRALTRVCGRRGFWQAARAFWGDLLRDPSRNRIRRFGHRRRSRCRRRTDRGRAANHPDRAATGRRGRDLA